LAPALQKNKPHNRKKTMTTSLVQPYLFFGGRCDEALEFYKTALGAQIEFLMRYNQSPEPMPPGMLAPGWEDKVMHATFHIGGSTLMASDGCQPGGNFAGFTLLLTVPTAAEAERVFAALAAGGKVTMPLVKTFWSPCFGMVEDRFGMGWKVSTHPEQ
jgi:PhnB protein